MYAVGRLSLMLVPPLAVVFLAGATETAPPVAGGSLVTILVGLLGGGLIAGGLQVYLRWRKGPIDDALQIQQATDLARKASTELFIEYRVELEEAKRQIDVYLDRLLRVNRELGQAEARINKLERELSTAHDDLVDLRHELVIALQQRDGLKAEIQVLREQIRKGGL